ncbi:hypothetical protein PAMP_023787 [Pampus punctatissimus]
MMAVTKEISYKDLKALLGKSQNLLLVDVRTKEEVDKGRIPGSVHIPLDTVEAAFTMEPEDFKAKYGVTKPPLDAPELVFQCQMGKRGAMATAKAHEQGYALRLVMILTKQRCVKTTGGLLVFLWAETPTAHLNCTGPCPEPDPEELCAFTDLHGSLRLLLSFQMKEARLFIPEWQRHVEAFLHTFSLANTGSSSVCEERRLVSGRTPCPWRQVATQYPTRSHGPRPVRRAERPACHASEPLCAAVLVYSPSNVPVTGPSAFFQNLLAHLDCQELGLQGLHCSSFTDLANGIVYTTVEQENCEEPRQESSFLPMKQNLLIFLFLQYSDPFISQLSDILAAEALIEHHLEDILNNNRRAITAALQTELRNTLKAQNHRNKDQEKLRSAIDVILSSSISIVSCSSNMDFRNACLNSMKVPDTHELSASLRESLRTVTSWKFIPKRKCHSAQMEEHRESDEPTRTEI